MRLPVALLLTVAGAAGLACNFNQEGVSPQADRLFFPGAIAIDPGAAQRWLYVANANADLRFNDGTLVTIDLDAVKTDREMSAGTWANCDTSTFTARPTIKDGKHCCRDLLDSNVLNCDETYYIQKAATVRIGSFASAIVVQPHGDLAVMDDGQRRLLIAVRGNGSITVVDVANADSDNPTLSCTVNAGGTFPECDEAHRVTEVIDRPTDSRVFLPDEPYAMGIDTKINALYIGHLKGGFISFIDLSGYATGALPELLGIYSSIFPTDSNGSTGVTSINVQNPGLPGDDGEDHRVYATSRFLPRAGSFEPIKRDPTQTGTIANTDLILANSGDAFVTGVTGAETRGIQFVDNADGNGHSRAFVLQRTPPALVAFERADGLNTPSAVIEVCSSPTFLDKYSPPSQSSNDKPAVALYVTCFESGEVYVVDPYAARVVAIIEAGRGPSGLAFSTVQQAAYVVGFGANNISVIDLAPGTTQYHVVQRIGFPTAVPF